MDHTLADFTLISLVAETIYRTVAAAAIIVGGGWAYLKYVRGRIMWNLNPASASDGNSPRESSKPVI